MERWKPTAPTVQPRRPHLGEVVFDAVHLRAFCFDLWSTLESIGLERRRNGCHRVRNRRGDKLATKEKELRRFQKELKQRERILVSRQSRLYNEQEEIRADLEVARITLSGQLAQEREALQRWQDMLENQEKELQRKAVEEGKKPTSTFPFTFSAGADEYDERQRRQL
ncbi:hypothetical protein BSKO_07871 [Bryopsis sp. KO-2023]|nr:hypothetical protein BSKO_07871 [Bryopsis sp. KO-2023]